MRESTTQAAVAANPAIEAERRARAAFADRLAAPADVRLQDAAPPGAEAYVRERLSYIGASSPIWARGDLGVMVDLQAVRMLFVNTVGHVIVGEKRKVVDAFEPYKNERIPKPTVNTAADVDASMYAFFAADRDEGVEQVDVDDSQRLVTCHACSRGRQFCTRCDGRGRIECEQCGGKSRLPCRSCSSGSVYTGPDYVGDDGDGGGRRRRSTRCSKCGGKGDVDCKGCVRGSARCPDCDGKKTVDCTVCDGRGKAIQVLRVVATRTRTAEIAEVSHPDLAPLLALVRIGRAWKPERLRSRQEIAQWVRTQPHQDVLKAYENTGHDWMGSSTAALLRAHLEPGDAREIDASRLERAIDELADLIFKKENAEAAESGPTWEETPVAQFLASVGQGVPPATWQSLEFAPVRADAAEHFGLAEPRDGAPAQRDELGLWHRGTKVLCKGIGKRPVDAYDGDGDDSGPFPAFDDQETRVHVRRLAKPRGFAPRVLDDGTVMVRDYARLVTRGWLVADYAFEGKDYRIFFGRHGSYAPGGSPISDEPDKLAAKAIGLLAAKQVEECLSCIKRALSDGKVPPTGDNLARLLTSLPRLRLPAHFKKAIINAIKDQIPSTDSAAQAHKEEDNARRWPDTFHCMSGSLSPRRGQVGWGRVTWPLFVAVRDQVDANEMSRRLKIQLAVVAGLLAVAGAVGGGLYWKSKAKVPVPEVTAAAVQVAAVPAPQPDPPPPVVDDGATHVVDASATVQGEAAPQLTDRPKAAKRGEHVIAPLTDGTRLRRLDDPKKPTDWFKVQVVGGALDGKTGFIHAPWLRPVRRTP